MLLRNGKALWFAVDGAARREHHGNASKLGECMQERRSPGEVVAVIKQRFFDRLAHIGIEMHQCGRPVLLERRTQARRVRNVAFEERSPFHCPAVTARKIVVGDRHVAFRGKRLAGVTADVARAAGHEDVHRTRPSLASFNPSSRKQFKSDPIIAAFRLPSVEQIPLSIALPSAHPCRFRADGPEETAVLAIGWRQLPPGACTAVVRRRPPPTLGLALLGRNGPARLSYPGPPYQGPRRDCPGWASMVRVPAADGLSGGAAPAIKGGPPSSAASSPTPALRAGRLASQGWLGKGREPRPRLERAKAQCSATAKSRKHPIKEMLGGATMDPVAQSVKPPTGRKAAVNGRRVLRQTRYGWGNDC